jgi:hypothetical protein
MQWRRESSLPLQRIETQSGLLSSHRLVSVVTKLSQLLAGMFAFVEEYSVQKFQVSKHELQELTNVERDERMIIYRDLEGIGEEIVMAYFRLHYLGICMERLKCSVRYMVFVPCN